MAAAAAALALAHVLGASGCHPPFLHSVVSSATARTLLTRWRPSVVVFEDPLHADRPMIMDEEVFSSYVRTAICLSCSESYCVLQADIAGGDRINLFCLLRASEVVDTFSAAMWGSSVERRERCALALAEWHAAHIFPPRTFRDVR